MSLTEKLQKKIQNFTGVDYGLLPIKDRVVSWEVGGYNLRNITQIFAVREYEGIIYKGEAPLVEGFDYNSLHIPTDHTSPLNALAEQVGCALVLGKMNGEGTPRRSMSGIYGLKLDNIPSISKKDLGILRDVVKYDTEELGIIYETELTLIAY